MRFAAEITEEPARLGDPWAARYEPTSPSVRAASFSKRVNAIMALTKFGFIVTGAKLDPHKHRVVMESAAFTMIAVGVERPEQGVDVATRLVAEGVQLIELCGGFGPKWTAKVIEAVGSNVPVGSVGYGPESIDAMCALFASS